MRNLSAPLTAILLGSTLAAQTPPPGYDPATMTRIRASSPTGGTAAFGVGGLVGSDVSSDNLLDINPANGTFSVIGKLGDDVVAALAWNPITQVLYATSTRTDNLLTIDPATGATKVVGTLGATLMHGLTYNLLDGKVYAANSFGTNTLYTVDVTTGRATAIGSHGLGALGDLAFDFLTGTMYASDIWTKSLYSLDLKTGKATLIGTFGTGSQLGVSLMFDLNLGLLATDNLASNTADDVLYRIDPKTGKATLIGAMGAGNVLGLAFVSGACLPAVSRSYGQGFPGLSGIPTLTSSPPVIGKAMSLNLSNTSGAATSGLLVINLNAAALPGFWGGTIHVDLGNAILAAVAVPANGLTLNLALAANSPCGVSVFGQGLLIDAAAAAGLSSTAGLEMRIGT